MQEAVSSSGLPTSTGTHACMVTGVVWPAGHTTHTACPACLLAYSACFRFVEDITGVGDLSGDKTDLSCNVYAQVRCSLRSPPVATLDGIGCSPAQSSGSLAHEMFDSVATCILKFWQTCVRHVALSVSLPLHILQGGHLLNHDDVIGTRAISFIIYLTDPDDSWTAENGGALELYPLVEGKRWLAAGQPFAGQRLWLQNFGANELAPARICYRGTGCLSCSHY